MPEGGAMSENNQLTRRERRELQRAAARAAQQAKQEQQNMPQQPAAQDWIVQFGLPGVAVGVGLTMTGFVNFMAGIVIMGLALFYMAIHWWRYSKGLGFFARYAVYAGIAIAFFFIGWLIWRPVPLEVSFLPMDDFIPEGTDVAGIKWSKDYSQVRVIFVNHSESDQFTNINFFVGADVGIGKVGFVSKFSQCGAESILPGTYLSFAVPGPIGPAAIFRVFCDRLLPKDKLEIALATVRTPNLPGRFADVSSKAKWMSIRGSFDGLGRSRTIEKSECLIKGCTGILPIP
jgi:hypothetical protein